MTRIVEYRGFKILFTAGIYWFNTLPFKTLEKAKRAIDKKIAEDSI